MREVLGVGPCPIRCCDTDCRTIIALFPQLTMGLAPFIVVLKR